MKTRILRKLKSSSLLFLWLLLTQTICTLFILVVSILALVSMALGGALVLGGSTPLWAWLTSGIPICLFWLVMGWSAPHAVRPRPAETVAVLTGWAALTSLMRRMDLILLAQRACGGMLEEILRALEHNALFDKGQALTYGCFLLPAAFGSGLLLRRKRTAAAGCDG